MTDRPLAPKRPHPISRHGDTRVDPYYWLMDRENIEVIDHLRRENEFLAAELGPLRPLEEEIFADIKRHIDETDTSVPVRRGAWWHFERTREGLNYAIACRAPVRGSDVSPPTIDPHSTLEGEEIVLD